MTGRIDNALDALYKAMGTEPDATDAADGAGDHGDAPDGDGDIDTEPAHAADDQSVGDVDDLGKSQNADGDGDEEEDDDDKDDEDAADGDGDDGDDAIDKSLTGDDEDDFSKALNSNPALAQLSNAIDEAFGGLQGALVKSMQQQEGVNEAVARGVAANINLTKSLLDMNKSLVAEMSNLAGQVARLSGQPAGPRRTASGNNPPQVLEKSVGGTPPGGPNQATHGLSKSMLGEQVKRGCRQGVIGVREAQIFDRTGTVPAPVFERIKDLKEQ